MTPEEAINQLGKQLIQRLSGIDFAPVAAQIRQVVLTSIDRSFSEGGRFGPGLLGGGGQHWERSQRAMEDDGQTLVDTGLGAASVQVEVLTGNGRIVLKVGGKEYLIYHHVGSEKINLPRRPVFVLQEQDIEAIRLIIQRRIGSLSSGR